MFITRKLLGLNRVITALLLWQLVSVYLMATAVWPSWIAWVNAALMCTFLVLAPAFEGLLLAVSSIAFYVVLPQPYSDTLSMWRPIIGLLFAKGLWSWFFAASPARLTERLRRAWKNFIFYEKIAGVLFAVAVLSLGLARYPIRGFAQLVFLLNAALLYFVVLWVVREKVQVLRLCAYAALSSGLVIALGYVQFIATLFSSTYYFWQYWALRVASLYYGLPLAKVLQYSNSWVTVQGEEKTLRMFSIMTSSHAFAMVCVFFLAFTLPLFSVYASRRARAWLGVAVAFACLALIISGTRGVWAGMVPALVIAGTAYYVKRLKMLARPILAAMLLVVVLFEASPLLDRTFAWIRHGGGEGTLDRVVSIIDAGETSNAGRLKMWKAASLYALRHPLGVGYANFVVALTPDSSVPFEEAASKENTLYRLPQRYITAHSLYLQVLVELGVAGLVLFGLFWFAFFKACWRFLRSEGLAATGFEPVFVATVVVVLLWFLAYGVFDVTWLNDKILLYTAVLLGLVRMVFTGNRLHTH